MGTNIDDVISRKRELMEEVNAKEVRHRFGNMSKREQREAVKSCATDVLMEEITRRSELMNKQIAEARKALKVSKF